MGLDGVILRDRQIIGDISVVCCINEMDSGWTLSEGEGWRSAGIAVYAG